MGRKKVNDLPVVIGCLRGGIKRLKDDNRKLFNDKNNLDRISREMQKTMIIGKGNN